MSTQSLTPELSQVEIRKRTLTLLFSIFIIALNGVIYELLIAGYSSYLLGDSITQFSLTIGLFMSAMGIGSWLTQRFDRHLERRFVEVELWLSMLGGPVVLLLAYAHIYTRLYSWVMFALIIGLGTLIGFEIPLVTRIVHRHGSLKEALANVLSFDYIGALGGSLLFPLILLPYLGFARTAFFIGIVNLAIAMLNLVVLSRDLGRSRYFLWLWAILIAIGLFIGFAFSTQWIERARESTSKQKLVYLEHTPYQTIRLVRDDAHPDRIHRLYLNGDHQFSTDTEQRYHEGLVYPALAATPIRKHILVLGGGDGLALREIWRYPGIKRVTLVDLDPAMTRFARTHPYLRRLNRDAFRDPRLTLIHQDAFLFLAQNTKRFDAIIIDLPVPTNIALSKLYSKEFYHRLHKALSPHGAITTEAANLDPVEKAPFWCLVETQRAAKWHVYPYIDATMAYTLMTMHPIQPTQLRIPIPTSHLTDAILRHSFAIPPDTLPTAPSPINTLETHHLMHLILALR